MARDRGLSARWKLTLSYAAVVVIVGFVLLAVVFLYLLRYVPDENITVPNRTDLVRAFTPPATWALLFLVGFGLAGGWLLAGRMLAPLTRISAVAERVAAGSLSHRVALEGRADEFRDLADVFDSMLDRLEAQVAEQKRFAANASHELRTPLAISQSLLDVARTDPERDADALIERLDTVNRRAIELTEALLTLSRADAGAFARETVDLSLLVEEAVETLIVLAERRGVEIRESGVPALVSGSPALLQQLVMNLVHNAIVHNVADGGRVAVRTSVSSEAAVLEVANSGPMLSQELIATLVEPFQRGAARTASTGPDHAGVGLGLAIAHRIAQAHDGVFALEARAEGGLCVTVRIPLSEA